MRERENVQAPEAKLRRALRDCLGKVRVLPDAIVASIDCADYCEDGKTFMLMCTTSDGRTMTVSIRPGELLSVALHDA